MSNDKELRARALTDLVDTIMRGEEFPRGVHKIQQITFQDIVGDSHHGVLVDVVIAAWKESSYESKEAMRELCRKYLNNSGWHTQMIEKLAEEENE